MAMSSIKEKLGKLVVNLGIKKLEDWSQKELDKIKKEPKAFCLEHNKNHYSIGSFDIVIQKDGTAKVTKDSTFVHHFQNKQVAIFYSAYEKLQKYKSSAELLQADTELAFAQSKYDHLSQRIKNTTNLDKVDRDVRLAKFQEAYFRFKNAKKEFKQVMIKAKHSNIWQGT